MEDSSTDIGTVWVKFTDKVGILLVPTDRCQDQFMDFRDHVLDLAHSQKLIAAFMSHADEAAASDQEMLRSNLVREMKGFIRAVDVAGPELQSDAGTKRRRILLKMAKTVAGSVGDVLNSLPFWARAIITLLKEAIELFEA